jgi:hypothetical protein
MLASFETHDEVLGGGSTQRKADDHDLSNGTCQIYVKYKPAARNESRNPTRCGERTLLQTREYGQSTGGHLATHPNATFLELRRTNTAKCLIRRQCVHPL